jgi:RNA polymerase sigma factor (sigma-70 family)
MARGPFSPFLRSLDALRRSGDSDTQLLCRFVADRDEAAFAELVRRHSSLVWHVCRQVLGHDQDAEDAFQATCLLLARRARTVRGAAVAGWLHGTAWRVAMKVRRASVARATRERRAVPPSSGNLAADLALRELQAILHEEVARLPAKCRVPFVLCVLEGRGRAEVARDLCWNEGTLSTRMADARKRLRARLARRGIDVTAALCAVELSRSAAPAALVTATCAAAVGGTVSPAVTVLVEGGVGSVFTARAHTIAALAVLAATMTAGSAAFPRGGPANPHAREPQVKAAVTPQDAPAGPTATCAVTVTGTATDSDGRPVGGAKVYLTVSNRILEKPLPTTNTDAQGRYAFRDVALPRILTTDVNGKPHLVLQVCGTAAGLAFDWQTLPYVEIRPVLPPGPRPGQTAFTADPLVADLKFGRPAGFQGRIVTDGGRPIVGAKVSIGLCNRLIIQAGGLGPSMIDNLFRPGDVIPGETTVTTDQVGAFQLDRLPKDLFARVQVEHRDFPSAQVTAATNAIAPGVESILIPLQPPGGTSEIWTEDIDLKFTRPRNFPVRVVSSMTLKPIAGAQVRMSSQGKVMLIDDRLTDHKREVTVRMPPGDHKLYVVAPGRLPGRVPAADDLYYVKYEEAVIVKADLAEQPRIVSLVPCCAVRAEVVDAATGQPLADVHLIVSIEGRGNAPAPKVVRGGPGRGRAVPDMGWERIELRGAGPTPQTDAQGRATIWTAPGRTRIRVESEPQFEAFTTAEPVTLEAGKEVQLRVELRKRQ